LRETAFAADRRARLEGKSASMSGNSARALTDKVDSNLERNVRIALAEMQDRLSQAEFRQKGAEERTVSMLDAIMSGLAGPGN